MTVLTEHEIFVFVAALGVIILAARIFGELAKLAGQPILVGELIAGILLGPTVLGRFAPGLHHELFPTHGPNVYLLQGISWLCVLFLLLITGIEIDVRASLRHGKRTFLTSVFGLAFPFMGIYFITGYMSSNHIPGNVDPLHFRLMLSTALSVAAIPVIAKILFDLKILRSFVGLNIITSGVLSDVWGWSILAVIISLITTSTVTPWAVIKPLLSLTLYLGFTVTAGRWIVNKVFDLMSVEVKDATSILSLVFGLTLINGAVAHLLGIHVIFGAFVAGIMAGESERLTPYMRQSIEDLIFAVFAPIFFVLIGMQLTITLGMDWGLILVLLVASSFLKIFGAAIGSLLGGIGRQNSIVVGCGLNTQGTMGIIVGLIGVELGVFNVEIFTIIVLICVVTSIFVGPFLKWSIKGVRRPLAKYFDREHVFLNVEGKTKAEVIKHMAIMMAERKIVDDADFIEHAILSREKEMSTAIGDGVAVPHARLEGLGEPVLCFFRLKNPVDFESADNKPVQLLFLELTDRNDDGMQLNLISQVARFLSSVKNIDKLMKCKNEEDVHHILSLDEKI